VKLFFEEVFVMKLSSPALSSLMTVGIVVVSLLLAWGIMVVVSNL
jgi:hypothetical protein